MSPPAAANASPDRWIARESISFAMDSSESLPPAVDRMLAELGGSVELLGLGEAMHGGEEFLGLRNRLFERLVEKHGFTAIAIESSFPRGRLVDKYVAGRGSSSYDAVRDAGFSHGFGALEANRDLVEWMRLHNADPVNRAKLRFYGFDSPTEMTGCDSPRAMLHVALDGLALVDPSGAAARRGRIDALLGDDAAWENPAAMMDPSKSIGLSPAAAALRVETEDLISELGLRRPEFSSRGEGGQRDGDRRDESGRDEGRGDESRADDDQPSADRWLEAAQHAIGARHLLNYHASLARPSDKRIAELLGIRDLTMAAHLVYAVGRERRRGGKVLAFAHNSHLKRGRATWQLGPHALEWWPAGAHVAAMLGDRYAVIGTGVAASGDYGIAPPEPGTLEARLTAAPGPVRFVPTRAARALAAAAPADLPTRSAATRNPGYFPFTAQSLTDFDALVVLDSITSARGGHAPR